MKRCLLVAMIFAVVLLSACEKSKPPTPKSSATPDTHPVKNVESLPSGTIREGARTMNRATDLGTNLEQQKQDRDKEAETQNK
ncbi:MAG: hypothetical protein HY067_08390 [Betaproteobacteria bacterium]|nr:hypothetical protein [Betaproteobacteria bacterium]